MYIVEVGLCKVWGFNLFFSKAIEEKPLEGSARYLGKGRVKSVYGTPLERVSLILVTLMTRSDSNFKHSNISPKKINGMALVQSLTASTTAFERMKEKFPGKILWFWQTEVYSCEV